MLNPFCLLLIPPRRRHPHSSDGESEDQMRVFELPVDKQRARVGSWSAEFRAGTPATALGGSGRERTQAEPPAPGAPLMPLPACCLWVRSSAKPHSPLLFLPLSWKLRTGAGGHSLPRLPPPVAVSPARSADWLPIMRHLLPGSRPQAGGRSGQQAVRG